MGPFPMTWYAMLTSPLRAYRVSGTSSTSVRGEVGGGAQPPGHRVEQRDGDLRVLVQDILELAWREHEAAHRRLRDDRRGPRTVVEERDLAEVIAARHRV